MAIAAPELTQAHRITAPGERLGLPAPRCNDTLIAVPDEQPTVRPVARYTPDADGDLDAVACISGEHLLVYVTGLVAGRREVVGLEILPLPDGVEVDAADLTGDAALMERLADAVASIENGRRRSVVSADMLRRMPVGPALEYRQEEARGALVEIVRGIIERLSAVDPGDRRQAQQAAYLPDVAAYVLALRERISPATLIGEARDISINAANSRISRSRMFGLLTSSGKAIAAGEATPEALNLFRQLGEDPDRFA